MSDQTRAIFELALALGKTVGELERTITYRELCAWNEFYLDRNDELVAANNQTDRRMYRMGDGPPPRELEKMSKEEIASIFGATIA